MLDERLPLIFSAELLGHSYSAYNMPAFFAKRQDTKFKDVVRFPSKGTLQTCTPQWRGGMCAHLTVVMVSQVPHDARQPLMHGFIAKPLVFGHVLPASFD